MYTIESYIYPPPSPFNFSGTPQLVTSQFHVIVGRGGCLILILIPSSSVQIVLAMCTWIWAFHCGMSNPLEASSPSK